LRRKRLYKKNKEDATSSPLPSTSEEILYETPKQGFIPGIGDKNDDVTEEEEAQTEERNVGKIARLPTWVGAVFFSIHNTVCVRMTSN